MQDLDALTKLLLKGEFANLTITCNDCKGSYQSVEARLKEDEEEGEASRYYADEDFVSLEDRQKCIDTNTLWTIHWYPNTPVGFCLKHASSFEVLYNWMVEYAKG